MRKFTVLVADDDPLVTRYLVKFLSREGMQVLSVQDGLAAVEASLDQPIDLLILDVMLPGLDGFEVCSRIRSESLVPILMLSVRGEGGDKAKALDLGADDYMTKPFSEQELLARIRSIIRRSSRRGDRIPRGICRCGKIVIDLNRRLVSVEGQQVRLTPTEFALLQELVMNAETVLTHTELLTRVWGPEYADDTEYLHVFISRLRRKLEIDPASPVHLVTMPRIGYTLLPNGAPPRSEPNEDPCSGNL